jgi:hypothetical protein
MSSDSPASTAAALTVAALAPTPRPAVIISATPDGAVLYSTETELYFGLNRTGACIWDNLYPKCETIDEICAALSAAFPGAERDRIEIDVRRLLARLAEKQLVDPRSAT